MATRVTLSGVVERVYAYSEKLGRYRVLLFAAAVIAAVLLGVALRGLAWPRWLKYGVFIDANDPWIEYWTGRYLYEHGLGSWWDLKPPNPAVMKFWYPWGRDFTRTSYPAVPAMIALGYSVARVFGLTLEQWAAWLPPLAGGLLVVVTAWLLYRRYGLLAGVIGAFTVALLPASSDRTLLGFIEKEGILLPFVILSIYFASVAFDRFDEDAARRLYSLLAGLAASIVGLGWGGYLYPIFVYAASILLLPAAGLRPSLKHIDSPLLYWVGLLPAMLFSRWRGLDAMFLVPGGVVLASALVIVVLAVLYEKLEALPRREAKLLRTILSNRLLYLVGGLTLIIVLFVAAAAAHVLPSRVAYLLLPGSLKSIAVAKVGPLVESVAEHNPDIAQLIAEVTPGVVGVALLGVLYAAYRVVASGKPGDLPVFLAVLVGIYAMFNAAYFTQTGGVFAAIAAALVFGVVEELRSRMGRRGSEEAAYIAAGVALLALVVVASVATAAASRIPFYAERLPAILTSAVTTSVYAPAWYKALLYIKANTTPETVVVSWWDYGYWISVVGDRASLADGATTNATQISLLARVLVGPYTEAVKILRLLRCKPNETLVIAYGVYLLQKRGNTLVAGLDVRFADIAKSYWMVRIGGFNVQDYVGPVQVPNVGYVTTFDPWKPSVRNAILYRLLFEAPLMLREEGVVKILSPDVAKLVSSVADVQSGLTVVVNAGGVRGAFIVPLRGVAAELLTPPPGFKPYLVAAYPVLKLPDGSMYAVIVAAFKWIG